MNYAMGMILLLRKSWARDMLGFLIEEVLKPETRTIVILSADEQRHGRVMPFLREKRTDAYVYDETVTILRQATNHLHNHIDGMPCSVCRDTERKVGDTYAM